MGTSCSASIRWPEAQSVFGLRRVTRKPAEPSALSLELSIYERLTGMVSPIFCLWFLASGVIGSEPDAKPIKRTVRADEGLNIVCAVGGKGDTALVFLHGWCGDHEYWRHQVDEFAADYRVVALDQAGHGDSVRIVLRGSRSCQ